MHTSQPHTYHSDRISSLPDGIWMQPELGKQGLLLMSLLASADLWLKCGPVFTQQLPLSRISCCLFFACIKPDYSSHKAGQFLCLASAGSANLLCFSAWPCPLLVIQTYYGLTLSLSSPQEISSRSVGLWSQKPFEPHKVRRNREIFSVSHADCTRRELPLSSPFSA